MVSTEDVPQHADLVRAVTDIARRHVGDGDQAALAGPDQALTDAGFNSLALVRFVVDLEREFRVTFPSGLLNGTTFHSVNTVAAAVAALRAG